MFGSTPKAMPPLTQPLLGVEYAAEPNYPATPPATKVTTLKNGVRIATEDTPVRPAILAAKPWPPTTAASAASDAAPGRAAWNPLTASFQGDAACRVASRQRSPPPGNPETQRTCEGACSGVVVWSSKGCAWIDAGWREPSQTTLRASNRPALGAFAFPRAVRHSTQGRREQGMACVSTTQGSIRAHAFALWAARQRSTQVTTSGYRRRPGWGDAGAALPTSTPMPCCASNDWRARHEDLQEHPREEGDDGGRACGNERGGDSAARDARAGIRLQTAPLTLRAASVRGLLAGPDGDGGRVRGLWVQV
jgi:hypothetical protein